MKRTAIIFLIVFIFPSVLQAGVWIIDDYLEINDGDVYDGELFIIDNGSVNMFGGEVVKLELVDNAIGNIYGGEIDLLWSDDNSIVNIFEGRFGILASRPESVVNIYAYDVTYHYKGGLYDQPWLEGKYIISNENFSFSFYGTDDFEQVNIVPEPSTLLLLGLGIVALIKRK